MNWCTPEGESPETWLEVGPLNPQERAACFIVCLLRAVPDAEVQFGRSEGDLYRFHLGVPPSSVIRAVLQSAEFVPIALRCSESGQLSIKLRPVEAGPEPGWPPEGLSRDEMAVTSPALPEPLPTSKTDLPLAPDSEAVPPLLGALNHLDSVIGTLLSQLSLVTGEPDLRERMPDPTEARLLHAEQSPAAAPKHADWAGLPAREADAEHWDWTAAFDPGHADEEARDPELEAVSESEPAETAHPWTAPDATEFARDVQAACDEGNSEERVSQAPSAAVEAALAYGTDDDEIGPATISPVAPQSEPEPTTTPVTAEETEVVPVEIPWDGWQWPAAAAAPIPASPGDDESTAAAATPGPDVAAGSEAAMVEQALPATLQAGELEPIAWFPVTEAVEAPAPDQMPVAQWAPPTTEDAPGAEIDEDEPEIVPVAPTTEDAPEANIDADEPEIVPAAVAGGDPLEPEKSEPVPELTAPANVAESPVGAEAAPSEPEPVATQSAPRSAGFVNEGEKRYRTILGDSCPVCRAVSRISFTADRPPQMPIAGCRDTGGCTCSLPAIDASGSRAGNGAPANGQIAEPARARSRNGSVVLPATADELMEDGDSGTTHGQIQIVAHPSFANFGRLNQFIRMVGALPGVRSVTLRRFRNGILRLAVDYNGSAPLSTHLRSSKEIPLEILSDNGDLIEIAVPDEAREKQAPQELANLAARGMNTHRPTDA